TGAFAEPSGDQSFLAARSIKRQLLEELSEPRGPTRAELADLLGRWPNEPAGDPDVAGLLFQDFRERSIRGEQLSRAEYEQRYPEHKDSLGSLFRRQDFLRSVTSASDPLAPVLSLPKVGDELFGFRLRNQLGQGAFARVFLAEQAQLAGRPVALKTSDLTGTEPQTLAQLQHTNIVPIYSVHEDQAAGIRAVCMPYFGGAALSQVLRTVWEQSNRPTRGAQLVAALNQAGGPPLVARDEPTVIVSCDEPTVIVSADQLAAETEDDLCQLASLVPEICATQSDPLRAAVEVVQNPASRRGKPGGVGASHPLTRLAAIDYLSACGWIIARLAEGLQHAHDRGVLHRDIKPSNILIGGDGTPMLLDFNLAHDDNQSQAQVEATLGGTVAYMAPEHLRALNIRTKESVKQVDHRSDIYGLGMVLFELITGHNPFDQTASYSPMPILVEAMAAERGRSVPSLRQFRDDAPWGLESIVRKCLHADPAQRYQRAEQLAEDLDRLLENRPLKFAPELSRKEQVAKWVRRHPRVASSALVAVVAAGLLMVGGLI
ncbi:MAG TPA: serine/threonine-protein kinase, partial [Planctomycetaceae bacterium]|nr:serine/threonine-protein kinase [Planctomycetaceae bacterium]